LSVKGSINLIESTGDSYSKWNWGNPKSAPTYGHAYTEYGSHLKPQSLINRASNKGFQIGQWLDQTSVSKFISGVAKNGPGVYDEVLPSNVSGRSFLGDGTELSTDMARIVVGKDGSITTAFPYNSEYPTMK